MYEYKTFTFAYELTSFLNKKNIKQKGIISVYSHGSAHVLVYREREIE